MKTTRTASESPYLLRGGSGAFMTITVSGRLGEGKTCIASILREALEMRGIAVDMGVVRFLEPDVAESLLQKKKLIVKIVEVEEP